MLKEAHTFAPTAKNSHWSEKSRRALHRTPGEVREDHVDCDRYPVRLTPLKWQFERDISPVIARGLLIEGLISVLEMDDGAGRRPTAAHYVFVDPREDNNRCVGAWSVVRCPGAAAILAG